jgi:DNA-binding transcriptional LysR family regulator
VAAGSVAVMRAWAQRGLGMSLLPEFAVRDQLAAGSLVRLDVDAVLRLVWRADRADHPELRELLYAASG